MGRFMKRSNSYLDYEDLKSVVGQSSQGRALGCLCGGWFPAKCWTWTRLLCTAMLQAPAAQPGPAWPSVRAPPCSRLLALPQVALALESMQAWKYKLKPEHLATQLDMTDMRPDRELYDLV